MLPRPLAGSGPLQEPRQLGEHARRVAPAGRHLAGREVDLPQRHGEAGHAVHQAQHLQALVAQEFGDGQGQVGGAAAQHRRHVGGRDHHHAARAALGAQRVLEKIVQLAAALADQPDHQHLGRGAGGDHRQQGRLADPRAREDPQALAVAARREQVERAHAERQPCARGRAAARPRCRAPGSGRRRPPAGKGGPPSIGRAMASMTRPRQAALGRNVPRSGSSATRAPWPMPSDLFVGESLTPASLNPTTSARIASRSSNSGEADTPRRSIRQTSPMPGPAGEAAGGDRPAGAAGDRTAGAKLGDRRHGRDQRRDLSFGRHDAALAGADRACRTTRQTCGRSGNTLLTCIDPYNL